MSGTKINIFPDILDNPPEYASHADALVALGDGELFRWSQVNTDGVISPFGSQLGITQLTVT